MTSTNVAGGTWFEGQTALVTGAAGGIGRAVARLLAERGAAVVLADRDECGAAEAAAGLPTCVPLRLDVTDTAECDDSVAAVVAKHGRLDLLVHAAGVLAAPPGGGDDPFVPLLEQDDTGWARVMEVNLTGGFKIMRAAGRAMAAAGSGAVVVVTSGGAVRPLPGRGPYCASKAGLAMLVKSFADELAPAGVRVNAVAPGIIETPMTADMLADPVRSAALALPPLGRFGYPEDVAEAIAFLLGRGAAFITGKTVFVDGGSFSG
jgi:NAD(P)-dependent dehydrogenase (short-subunit alcohol dehydrogenase family)